MNSHKRVKKKIYVFYFKELKKNPIKFFGKDSAGGKAKFVQFW